MGPCLMMTLLPPEAPAAVQVMTVMMTETQRSVKEKNFVWVLGRLCINQYGPWIQ